MAYHFCCFFLHKVELNMALYILKYVEMHMQLNSMLNMFLTLTRAASYMAHFKHKKCLINCYIILNSMHKIYVDIKSQIFKIYRRKKYIKYIFQLKTGVCIYIFLNLFLLNFFFRFSLRISL